MNEPRTLTVGSLFSGIGGIDLGFERAGMSVSWQCEFDPFCREVLRRRWPDVPCYEDVRSLGTRTPMPERVDVLAGGYPCQPFSVAGRRRGSDDPRHLWPEFARLVGDIRPRYVVGENVRGHTSKGLDIVLADLSSLGYDAEWQVVSAASLGAPHLRERIFIVAYADDAGRQEQRRPGSDAAEQPAAERGGEALADADGPRRVERPGDVSSPGGRPEPSHSGQALADADGVAGAETDPVGGRRRPLARQDEITGVERCGPRIFTAQPRPAWCAEPGLGRVADGIPRRVDRLRTLGNAVVPQVAEYVGRLILDDWRHHAPQDCSTAGRGSGDAR